MCQIGNCSGPEETYPWIKREGDQLNKINDIREGFDVGTILKRAVEDALYEFIGSFNTHDTREAITVKLVHVMELLKDQYLIYNYKVTCNNENNNVHIIDDHRLVVDIIFESPKSVSRGLNVTIGPPRINYVDDENQGKQIFSELDPYGEENWDV